jgi:hypothetical protein
LLFLDVSVLRIAPKKIIIQQIADFQKQVRVDPFAAEEFVHILPRVAQLRGKPSDAPPLSCQFCLDEFPYVQFFVHRFAFAGALRGGQTKRAETVMFAYLKTEGSAKPVKRK